MLCFMMAIRNSDLSKNCQINMIKNRIKIFLFRFFLIKQGKIKKSLTIRQVLAEVLVHRENKVLHR